MTTGTQRLMADLNGDTSLLTPDQQRERRRHELDAKILAATTLDADTIRAVRMIAESCLIEGNFADLVEFIEVRSRIIARLMNFEGFCEGQTAVLSALDRTGPRARGERQSDEVPDRVLPLVKLGPGGDFNREVMP